jgi:hypothetical protein
MRSRLLSFTLISIILISSSPLWAESLTVEPLSQNVLLGDTVSVDIDVSGATDLYGWQFSLGYDGTILSLLSVSAGSLLGTGGSTFWYAPDTSTSGEIISGTETLLGSVPGVDGSGTLLSLNFNTIAVGTSPVNIYVNDADPGLPTEMLNSSGNPISFSSTNGGITVVVPEPISATLFLLSLNR